MRGEAWPDGRLDLLRKLWAEGKTAGAIAARLDVSRSAVLGKVFRLRLGMRDEPPAPQSKALRRRRAAARRENPAPPSPAPAKSRGTSLLELTNDTCRWPHGNPRTKSFFFCGAPGADLERGMPYCPRHAERAFVQGHDGPEKVARWVPRRAPPTAVKVRVTTNPKWWRA
jgi:GcrA cell cycle regulator